MRGKDWEDLGRCKLKNRERRQEKVKSKRKKEERR